MSKGKSYAFSICLIMVVMMLVGAATIPLLNVQYWPSSSNQSLSVSFSYRDASARVVDFSSQRAMRFSSSEAFEIRVYSSCSCIRS